MLNYPQCITWMEYLVIGLYRQKTCIYNIGKDEDEVLLFRKEGGILLFLEVK